MYYAQGSVRSLLKDVIDLDNDCYLSDAIKCDKQFCSVKGKTLDRIAERCTSRFLLNEISILQPKAIIAVGRIAFELLTGIKGKFISRQNDGKEYYVRASRISVHPVIHPSYANIFYGGMPWQQNSYDENFVQTVGKCL
jgi:uracil-DNA glycosylase family 4